MDREQCSSRQVCNRYVVDDGWSPDMPMEITEIIDLRVQIAEAEAYKRICREHDRHKGDWITAEIAYKYAAKSWVYRILYGGQYIREVREIGKELQEKYGVSEIEAINILNENNVDDYLNKYYRIQHRIPLNIDREDIIERTLEEYKVAI